MTDVLDDTELPAAPGEGEPVEPIEGDDDDTEDTPAEQEPEPEHTGAVSERDIEIGMEKLEREAKRHTARVSEIMGDDATALVVCELCEPAIPGFRFQTVPEDDPRHMLVLMLSEGGEVTPPEDDEAERCDRCDGFGVTRTHSRVPGQETKPCSKCSAKGWTTQTERQSYTATMGAREVAAEIQAHSVAAPPAPPFTPAIDAWGRPQGAPFFGTDPLYMTEEQKVQDWQRTVGR